ncbi:hypothetical protein NECID01_1224 [Nematocida sp. AWRm77]|nr:hypothetical protein NECID01_1224 [Nematocida sp. AWRm77]
MDSQIIEVSKLRGEKKIIDAKPNQSVYISDIEESQVMVRGKCIKIVVIDIKRSFIAAESIISNMEITRAKSSSIFLSQGSMMNLEQCVECKIATCSESTELRLQRNISLSLVVLPQVDMQTASFEEIEESLLSEPEHHLPEEIKAVLSKGNLSFSIGGEY